MKFCSVTSVGIRLVRRAVERVDLLPQHRAFERATGFTLFNRGQSRRQDRIIEQHSCGLRVVEPGLAEVFARVGAVEEPGEVVRDAKAIVEDAGVEPRAGQHRRDM